MSRKNRLPTLAATLAALPATTTTDGVVAETGIVQAAKVETHQDDNLAGDIAAAIATGDASGLIADGAVSIEVRKIDGEVVVEPVIVPRPDGDEAGDTAVAVVTGEESDLDRADQQSVLSLGDSVFPNTPESEPVIGEAGNSASLSIRDAVIADLVVHTGWDFSSEEDFKKNYPLTFAMMSDHHEITQPVLRVTPKTGGFRRGGFSHPAGTTEYPALSLGPAQIEAILGEPELVVEIV